MLGQRNTKKQGDVGLGAAIGWYTENEYTVSIPLTDSQDYDLVVGLVGSALRRVQVKTATYQNKRKRPGTFELGLRLKGGNKSGTGTVKFLTLSEDIDDFFILTGDRRKYIVPRLVIAGLGSIDLGGPDDLRSEYLV